MVSGANRSGSLQPRRLFPHRFNVHVSLRRPATSGAVPESPSMPANAGKRRKQRRGCDRQTQRDAHAKAAEIAEHGAAETLANVLVATSVVHRLMNGKCHRAITYLPIARLQLSNIE